MTVANARVNAGPHRSQNYRICCNEFARRGRSARRFVQIRRVFGNTRRSFLAFTDSLLKGVFACGPLRHSAAALQVSLPVLRGRLRPARGPPGGGPRPRLPPVAGVKAAVGAVLSWRGVRTCRAHRLIMELSYSSIISNRVAQGLISPD